MSVTFLSEWGNIHGNNRYWNLNGQVGAKLWQVDDPQTSFDDQRSDHLTMSLMVTTCEDRPAYSSTELPVPLLCLQKCNSCCVYFALWAFSSEEGSNQEAFWHIWGAKNTGKILFWASGTSVEYARIVEQRRVIKPFLWVPRRGLMGFNIDFVTSGRSRSARKRF